MNEATLTEDERAYLLDHLDLHEFSPVVPSSAHRACVARGLIEEIRPGWYRVRSGMRRALRASTRAAEAHEHPAQRQGP